MKVKCPHCDAVSHSIVAYETNLLGYLLAVFAILVFGALSLLMMPFLVGLTKQAVHKCARCLNDVKQSSLLGLNSLEDKVIAKKIGNFGIILTRRYLLYIVAVIGAFMSIYTFIVVEEKNHGISKSTLNLNPSLQDTSPTLPGTSTEATVASRHSTRTQGRPTGPSRWATSAEPSAGTATWLELT